MVTINTARCDPPYEERIRWMAEQLVELKPAIVACQEVFVSREARVDTGRRLAEELGMELAYTPARRKERPWNAIAVQSESGMAILSRVPLSDLDTVHLPSDRRGGERVAQIAGVAIDGVRLVVANVHLTHLPNADKLRLLELRSVLAHPLLCDKAATRILCGDFNTTREGPVLCEMAGLQDCWELGGGSGPRGTVPASGPPGRCIDYIFAVGGREPATFRNSRIVLDRRDAAGRLASDHLGVMTEILVDQEGAA